MSVLTAHGARVLGRSAHLCAAERRCIWRENGEQEKSLLDVRSPRHAGSRWFSLSLCLVLKRPGLARLHFSIFGISQFREAFLFTTSGRDGVSCVTAQDNCPVENHLGNRSSSSRFALGTAKGFAYEQQASLILLRLIRLDSPNSSQYCEFRTVAVSVLFSPISRISRKQKRKTAAIHHGHPGTRVPRSPGPYSDCVVPIPKPGYKFTFSTDFPTDQHVQCNGNAVSLLLRTMNDSVVAEVVSWMDEGPRPLFKDIGGSEAGATPQTVRRSRYALPCPEMCAICRALHFLCDVPNSHRFCRFQRC
eukprot:605278-Rhodomonas_salina.3